MELRTLQTRVNEWARENFGPSQPPHAAALLGANEEFGELCSVLADQLLELLPVLLMARALGEANHAQLKGQQGIRGTAAEHEAKGKDAVGDIGIYLMNYCGNKGWDLQTILEETFEKTVAKRNWKANPTTGTVGNPEMALTLFEAAAEKLIDKVESGRAHSIDAYADLKEALQTLRGAK